MDLFDNFSKFDTRLFFKSKYTCTSDFMGKVPPGRNIYAPEAFKKENELNMVLHPSWEHIR